MKSEFIADLSELDAADTHPLAEFEARFGRGYVTRLPQRYWIHMGGRALETFRPYLAEKYPILAALFHEGICRIFKMAQEKFDYTPAKENYINKCDLCTEIRTFLVKNDFGGTADLKPREFFQSK